MSDTLIACVPCNKEMKCLKAGAVVHYGGGYVKSADVFGCTDCGAQTARINPNGYTVQNIEESRQNLKEWFIEMSDE